MTELLVATRSADKLREIRSILDLSRPCALRSVADVLPVETADEGTVERYGTFEQNAAAKALYFARLTGLRTLADDSGLCVDALGGRPGVRSRRYAADRGIAPSDESNNALLLEELRGVAPDRRTARFVCAVAVAEGADLLGVRIGSCSGLILAEPQGHGGFGYDPLFWVPSEQGTFAEISADRKNAISHRSNGLRAIAPLLSIQSGAGALGADSVDRAPRFP